jgi:AraC-like DNA-binding protein
MARALPTLASTAVQLRMPERTLQRLLAQTGVTYRSLLDDIRRELALKWIGDARLGMSEIGFLLHFSDTTGFYRAFKRWTGETPIEYRRHLFDVVRSATQPKREEQPAPCAT